VIGLAGYKTISLALLIVLVMLVCVSPVLAGPSLPLAFDPPAACPGTTVTVTFPTPDIVGGGISVAAVSPLNSKPIWTSSPAGLITNPECDLVTGTCTFVVSESATCGLSYGVTLTLGVFYSYSGQFDVTCCPVGGCVQPVNAFALLSPWLAVIGLVGCIGAVVVVAKKRHP